MMFESITFLNLITFTQSIELFKFDMVHGLPQSRRSRICSKSASALQYGFLFINLLELHLSPLKNV